MLLSYAYLYICVWICTHVCRCLWRPKKSTGFPGAGVSGDFELPVWMLGPELWQFPWGVRTMNYWISTQPYHSVWDSGLRWFIHACLAFFVIYRGAEGPLGRVCPQTVPWAGEGGTQSKERRPDPSTHRGLEGGHWTGHWLFRCPCGIHCWLVGHEPKRIM